MPQNGNWETGIRRVGETVIRHVHRAHCHCGRVQLDLTLPHGIVDPRRCDCSMCRRRGAIAGTVSLSGLRVVAGEDALSCYQFNTHTARHYFCRFCGIYTHHQRRSNPDEYGYNIACLEGVNPLLPDALGEVPTSDGVNHITDRQQGDSE